jgi:hypothetical protein
VPPYLSAEPRCCSFIFSNRVLLFSLQTPGFHPRAMTYSSVQTLRES